MKNIRLILFKVLVKQFYHVNAGFFLILVGICFGFLRDVEHLALARYFTSSVIGLMIPITAWLLYSLKIATFNNLSLAKKENEFLFEVGAINPLALWIQCFIVTGQQFLPVLIYSIFLIITAEQVHNVTVVPVIISSVFILNSFISAMLYRKIVYPDSGIRINFIQRKFNAFWTRPYTWIYPEWITKKQPILVIGTKIFACLMIIGISRLYLFDTYDERLLGMGCTLAFAFNLVIVYYYHRFENFHFQLLRGLPLSLNRRLASFSITWALLVLPEIGAIINYFPSELSVSHLFIILLFGMSLSLLSYSCLFIHDITLETFLHNVFLATFLWIILILFKVPVALLAIVNSGIAVTIYRKHFYRFEFNSEINSEK